LHDLLAGAEAEMHDGKFDAAIQKFTQAERVAPNNPLTVSDGRTRIGRRILQGGPSAIFALSSTTIRNFCWRYSTSMHCCPRTALTSFTKIWKASPRPIQNQSGLGCCWRIWSTTPIMPMRPKNISTKPTNAPRAAIGRSG